MQTHMDLIDWWHAHYYNLKFVDQLIIIIVSLAAVNKAKQSMGMQQTIQLTIL